MVQAGQVVWAALILAAGVVAGSGAGAEDHVESARVEALRRDLGSEERSKVAWAAYSAGKEGLRALVPDLLQCLAGRPTTRSAGGESWRVEGHLLDALVRLDARLPTKEVERLAAVYERPCATLLILALRNGEEAHPFLRRVLAADTGKRGYRPAAVAAGNALVARKNRGVAAVFLPRLAPEVRLRVFDDDGLRIGGGVSFGGGIGCGWYDPPPGFPPFVCYRLQFAHAEDRNVTMLARGPVRDVGYSRTEHPNERFIHCGEGTGNEAGTSEMALGWAASLLDERADALALKPTYYEWHRWTDAKSYRAFVEARLTQVSCDAAALFDRLVPAGFLTAEARAALTVKPRLFVEDERTDRSVPLPDVGATAR